MGELAEDSLRSLMRNGMPMQSTPRPDVKKVPGNVAWFLVVVTGMSSRDIGTKLWVTETDDPMYYYVRLVKTGGPNKGQFKGYGTIERRAVRRVLNSSGGLNWTR